MRVRVCGLIVVVSMLLGCSGSPGDPPNFSPEPPQSEQCPSHFKFTFVAGNEVKIGWTGVGHDTTLALNSFVRVKTTTCSPDCRNCAFAGPVRDHPVVTQRCVGDTSIVCDSDADCPPWECRNLDPSDSSGLGRKVCAHNGQSCDDSESCGNSTCAYFLGPPFPVFQGQVTCAAVFFANEDPSDTEPPVTGLINTETGRVSFDRFFSNTGTTDFSKPGKCAVCVGDLVANDGKRDGECQTAGSSGPAPVRSFPYDEEVGIRQSCDRNGEQTFNGEAGYYSLDCTQPLGVALSVGFTEGNSQGVRRTLTSDQPSCGPEDENGNKRFRCWCGLCSETRQACASDDECPSNEQCVADDIESSDGITVPIRPNACRTTCEVEEGQYSGTCLRADNTQEDIETKCFPGQLGSVIDVPGSSVRRSDGTFLVQLGNISCRQPAQYTVPGPVGIQTDISLGLPGLQIDSLSFVVEPQEEQSTEDAE